VLFRSQLKPPELAAIRAAGLALCVVSETTAGRALAGYSAGRTDARIAVNYCASLGMPSDMVVYWAADMDFAGSTIDAYARGWRDEIGVHRCGVYGGIDVIKWCFDHGQVSYGWQTFAWSEGHIDPRANAYQWMNSQSLAGNTVDYDAALTSDYGQWEPGGSTGDRGVIDMTTVDLTPAAIEAVRVAILRSRVDTVSPPPQPADLPANVEQVLRQVYWRSDLLNTLAGQAGGTANALADLKAALAALPAAIAALPGAAPGGTLTEADVEQALGAVLGRTSLTVNPPPAP